MGLERALSEWADQPGTCRWGGVVEVSMENQEDKQWQRGKVEVKRNMLGVR